MLYKPMSKISKYILLSLFSLSLQADLLSVEVFLIPAGGFTIESDQIRGRVRTFNSKLLSDKISVKVKDLSSGVDLRDQHIHKYLKGSSERIQVENIEAWNDKGTGTLILNNMKKEIHFDFVDKKDHVEASFDLKCSDYGLKSMSYMGIGVADRVKVKISLDKNVSRFRD